MSYKIERQIIPGLTQRNLVSNSFIVGHESGNSRNNGPDALENEIKFMTTNWRNAFVSHWVGGGGRIVQLAEVGKIQYGAGPKANPHSYAHVELARTTDPEVFKKDYAAYVWLLRKLADDAGIPKTLDVGSSLSNKGIKSHNWITQNLGGTTHSDPFGYLAMFGISKSQFKKDIEAGTTIIKPTKPKVKPATVNKNFLSKGDKGSKVKKMQQNLIKLGYNVGATGADGIFGANTEKAVLKFQEDNNIAVDGLYGPASEKAMTAALKSGKKAKSKPKAKLKVDGIWGTETTKALQRYFGTPVDGVISKPSLVIKALQGLVGTKRDGILGPNTITAMQKRFGTTQDGVISKPTSTVVKELQKRLNTGKL